MVSHRGNFLRTIGIDAAVAEEAIRIARKSGAIISYDLNYRPSLWQSIGGKSKAREVNRALMPFVDVLIGNEEDFTAALGYEVARRG